MWVRTRSLTLLVSANPSDTRVDHLRKFRPQVAQDAPVAWAEGLLKGNWSRRLLSRMSAGMAMTKGVPGFFVPRLPFPWLYPTGAIEATSFYDTTSLKSTLERLIDFDRINSGEMRLSVGAVNVRTGNFVYFDTTTHSIRPEQVMASGALRQPTGKPTNLVILPTHILTEQRLNKNLTFLRHALNDAH